MLLVVDVGNTQTHFGTFEGTELTQHWRFATVRESTADELGAKLANLLALRGLAFDQLEGSIVSSTVPQLGAETATIATGGLAAAIVPYTEEIDEVDDLLTLTGLRLLHQMNTE